MRLGLDIDNCLVDWQDHWAELYRQWFDDWSCFDYDKEAEAWPLDAWDACLTHTRFNDMQEFYRWFARAGGWDTIPWENGAQGFLYDLKQLQIPFVFVTSRPPEGRYSAVKLASEWGTSVHFCPNDQKWTSFGADCADGIWVDDAPEVLQSLADHDRTSIRFARPWNEGSPATYTAQGWNEVLSIIKELR